MNINELKESIINGMSKIVVDYHDNNSEDDMPIDELVVLDSLKYSVNWYKEWLKENINNFNLTHNQIDELVKECTFQTYHKFIK